MRNRFSISDGTLEFSRRKRGVLAKRESPSVPLLSEEEIIVISTDDLSKPVDITLEVPVESLQEVKTGEVLNEREETGQSVSTEVLEQPASKRRGKRRKSDSV